MKRLLVPFQRRRDVIQRDVCRSSHFFERRCSFSKMSKLSGVDDAAPSSTTTSIAGRLHNKLLKAPFQRVGPAGSPLFPWRHSQEPLPRLIPGSEEFAQVGYLVGGNVLSSNPAFDAFATAYLFLDVPWYKMLFFSQWQADLAENMSWAFAQATAGLLSNAYRVPFDEIAKANNRLDFEQSLGTVDDNPKDGVIDESLEDMVEERLRNLYASACEHGKDQIQVRLQCQPTGAHMVNIFVFPFVSRSYLKKYPELNAKYQELLDCMNVAPRSAMPIYHDLVGAYQSRGVMESTVICQVLVACDEIFWVKDLATGATIQGHEDGQVRKVWHLVRMEKVIETHPANRPILPFKHKQGNWQITDIDDLLEGNLLL